MGNTPNSFLARTRSQSTNGDSDNTKKVVIEYPNGDVYEGELIEGGSSSVQSHMDYDSISPLHSSMQPSEDARTSASPLPVGSKLQPAASDQSRRSSFEQEALRIGMREGSGRFIAKDRTNERNYEYRG